MYKIRYQKIDRQTRQPANGAYSVDEFADYSSFLAGIVETAQFRIRGFKYRLMESVIDGDDVTLRFDFQPTGNVKE